MFVLTGAIVGGPTFHRFTVVAPAGWSGGENVVHAADTLVAGLKVSLVRDVPRDPCHWKTSLVTPGRAVDDLVEALVAQQLRDPSTPTDVTLAGYSGKFLEWSVPDDMVVTGDGDFHGCDATAEGHTDFISWVARDGGHRYHKVAGERDLLWILDVNGQTTVVDAMYTPSATATVRAELLAIVQTLQLEVP